jgi:hypothetical protein
VSCATSVKDVWYSFTADSTGGFYVLDTEGSAQIDPVLAVFSACGGTQLGCDDDSGTGRQSRIGILLSGNTNVKARLASFSSEPNGGGYHLNVAKVASGACCPHLASACRISDSVGCTDGVYSGNGTTCQPDPCPPVGACKFGPCCFQSRGQ